MTEQDARLRRLLQLKKLETPGTAYFDAFLDEFHRYQRAELLQKPSLKDRLASWFETLALAPRAYSWSAAGAVACVLLVFGAVVVREAVPQGVATAARSVQQAGYVQVPAQDAALVQAPEELAVATASSFDKDFSSPRYVTGQALVAYDTSLAF